MRKICAFILALTMCCFSLAACKSETQSEEFNTNRFFYVNTGEHTRIYVDKKTGVMYLWVSKDSNRGGLTVMLDENGKPLLWDGDLQNG